jgi:hypothetical protein
MIKIYQVKIKVGFMMPNGYALDNDVAYKTSAGAVIVAQNNAIKNGIYNPQVGFNKNSYLSRTFKIYNITFVWEHPQCEPSLSIGFATNMIKKKDVSAIFGPGEKRLNF